MQHCVKILHLLQCSTEHSYSSSCSENCMSSVAHLGAWANYPCPLQNYSVLVHWYTDTVLFGFKAGNLFFAGSSYKDSISQCLGQINFYFAAWLWILFSGPISFPYIGHLHVYLGYNFHGEIECLNIRYGDTLCYHISCDQDFQHKWWNIAQRWQSRTVAKCKTQTP